MSRIRIAVVDDTTLVRRLLALQLAREPDFELAGEAAGGREAVDLALRERPDVMVMDLHMPDLNGVQATERILSRRPECRVLILTMHEELTSLGKLSGACECLSKDCTPQELNAAIRRAYRSRGNGSGEPGTGQNLCGAVERLATRAGLTEHEKAVLYQAVASELTNQQIASALSAESGRRISEAAVKHALNRIMTKLRIEPRTRAALVRRVLESR